MKGSGTTLLVALSTVAIGTFFGVLLGAFTGYFGGLLDEVLMRIIDAVSYTHLDVYKRQHNDRVIIKGPSVLRMRPFI